MEGYTVIHDPDSCLPQPPQSVKRWRTVAGLVVGAACMVGAAVYTTSMTAISRSALQLDGLERDAVETLVQVPTQWKQTQRADPSAPMVLHLAIKHPEGLDLESELMAVSDPTSARFGQHLSLLELNDLTAPSTQALSTVQAWLDRHSVTNVRKSAGRDFITVDVSVAEAEELLDAKYYEFVSDEGVTATRTTSYSVPTSVAGFLDFVAPTVQFPNTRSFAAHAVSADNQYQQHTYITPSILRSLYNLDDEAVGGGDTGNRQVATGFLDEEYCPTDLASFYSKFDFVTDLSSVTVSSLGDTTDDDPGCGDEANLDVQYITAVAEQVPTEFWSFPGYSPDLPAINEPFLDFMMYLNSVQNPPWVVSTSYGEDEGSTSETYALRVQAEFMKAGLRGVSLFFASGDSGVASMFAQNSCTQFTPQWPAGSPWVTSVGATQGTSSETAAYFSSGGFSNRWGMPDYQRETVESYLHQEETLVRGYVQEGFLPGNLYAVAGSNNTGPGRAFPDVSAAGHNFLIVLNGNVYSVDGTSASTPVFAGVVSIVNEKRLQAGKGPLGFLNPLLYKYGTMFNDITSGNNPGCSTDGFSAVNGWDPVTGLGTPDYKQFVEVALGLP